MTKDNEVILRTPGQPLLTITRRTGPQPTPGGGIPVNPDEPLPLRAGGLLVTDGLTSSPAIPEPRKGGTGRKNLHRRGYGPLRGWSLGLQRGLGDRWGVKLESPFPQQFTTKTGRGGLDGNVAPIYSSIMPKKHGATQSRQKIWHDSMMPWT
jgi:hypothetical protein